MYYTGKGDNGTSSVIGYTKIAKHDPIFEAVGSIDELNSAIGVAVYYTHNERVRTMLKKIQNDLFKVGALLAGFKNTGSARRIDFGIDYVKKLEEEINAMAAVLPQYKKFIIPGGSESAVHLHLARAIARRAERSVIGASEKYKVSPTIKKYLNRLSSYLFVAALYVNYSEGINEEHPEY